MIEGPVGIGDYDLVSQASHIRYHMRGSVLGSGIDECIMDTMVSGASSAGGEHGDTSLRVFGPGEVEQQEMGVGAQAPGAMSNNAAAWRGASLHSGKICMSSKSREGSRPVEMHGVSELSTQRHARDSRCEEFGTWRCSFPHRTVHSFKPSRYVATSAHTHLGQCRDRACSRCSRRSREAMCLGSR